jgi:hypothetical protein
MNDLVIHPRRRLALEPRCAAKMLDMFHPGIEHLQPFIFDDPDIIDMVSDFDIHKESMNWISHCDPSSEEKE